MQHGGNNVIIL